MVMMFLYVAEIEIVDVVLLKSKAYLHDNARHQNTGAKTITSVAKGIFNENINQIREILDMI
ncbi:hypothetical protein [Streptococcus sp. S784/96/1]|uniref:hypothetical protein n=1 Tax=Streptococcus sp. S784/96/1 TaxID=2653499 RepID=UPI001389A29C|nr:hypothetical protein [Streptococcus sp. S784/96/1]